MIAATILIVHAAVCVYAFLKYKKEGLGEGVLAVAFVVIIFSVGWTITTMVARLIFPQQLASHWVTVLQEGGRVSHLLAKELSVDTFSLVLLTVGEAFFYYFYLRSGNKKEGVTNAEK